MENQRTLEERLSSLETQMESLLAQCQEEQRLRRVKDDYVDTFVTTPLWKRIMFWLDGWSAHELVDAPRWRPWHRWWVS